MQQSGSFDASALGQQLAEGIDYLNLEIDSEKQARMLAYLERLLKWNQAYNLSGIRDPQRMLTLHLLDSLSILPFIDADRILDVGTGAGLPGIPLAICLPHYQFSLLDSNGKKMSFVFQTCSALEIGNVDIIQQRVESYQSEEAFAIVLSRAFSSLQQFIEQTRHLLAPQGRLLAMKGQLPREELQDIPQDFRLLKVHELDLPGEPAARHLLELGRR